MVARVALLDQDDPTLLDRYQLIGELASGGMATVFLGRLAGVGGFQRFVAIKRLHPHLAREQEFVEMFLDEARLAASIHHQNVVPILEIGTNEGGYYLVMEYIEGVTLARLMGQATVKEQPIGRPILLRIVVDTLNGLHAAHELTDDETRESLGVVHRDCSPQNILVGVDGCSRITDFGVARASSRIANTRDGAMKGKLAYMAPEQTQGEDLDRRADLFSVGVVLWEVLTARRLFKTKSEAQTLRRLLVEPIPPVSQIVKDVHPAFDRLCLKALARDPAERFQTAAEMVEALELTAREWGAADKLEEPIATARTVAGMMKRRYGGDVSQQREAVRSWIQASPSVRGQEPRATDRGWLAPLQPASGPDSQGVVSAPSTDKDWLAVERSAPSVEEPVAAAADEGEPTHIYDSPSAAEPVSERIDAAPVESQHDPTTERSPEERLVERRWGRWALAAMAGVFLAGGMWLLLRSGGEPQSRDDTRSTTTVTSGVASSAASGSTPAGHPVDSHTSSRATVSSLASSSAPVVKPVKTGPTRSQRPPPSASIKPTTTSIPTKSAPPDVDNDLSNPYR